MKQQNVTQELTMAKREINRKIERGEAKASDFGPVITSAPKRRVDLSGKLIEIIPNCVL